MDIDELWEKYKAIDIIKGLDDADGIMTKRNFTLAISEEISSPVEPEVMQKPKPKTLQAIFEIVNNVDFELARLEDIAKGEIGDEITLLRKYIDENRVSA